MFYLEGVFEWEFCWKGLRWMIMIMVKWKMLELWRRRWELFFWWLCVFDLYFILFFVVICVVFLVWLFWLFFCMDIIISLFLVLWFWDCFWFFSFFGLYWNYFFDFFVGFLCFYVLDCVVVEFFILIFICFGFCI